MIDPKDLRDCCPSPPGAGLAVGGPDLQTRDERVIGVFPTGVKTWMGAR